MLSPSHAKHAFDAQECKACHEAKPLTEYYRSVTNRDGLVSKCKRCMAQSNQRKVSVAIIACIGSSALKLSNSSPTHQRDCCLYSALHFCIFKQHMLVSDFVSHCATVCLHVKSQLC